MLNKFLSFVFMMLITSSSLFGTSNLNHQFSFPLEKDYQKLMLRRVAEKLPCLVAFPFYAYPNTGFEEVSDRFSDGKILVFGYGSLMNKLSASRSVKEDAVGSIHPAIALGVKRLFNYKATVTKHWGEEQHAKEKAMLNMVQTLNISSVANGVTIEVDLEDFKRLVQRETGYDLVPILVASWDDVLSQNPQVNIQVAYTFVASHELRNHIDYTSTEYYPVRGYLHAIQDASLAYGEDFARMWNATTYLADGTTSVNEWDEVTFMGILCTHEP
jgi:cation transport regulator ChaC